MRRMMMMVMLCEWVECRQKMRSIRSSKTTCTGSTDSNSQSSHQIGFCSLTSRVDIIEWRNPENFRERGTKRGSKKRRRREEKREKKNTRDSAAKNCKLLLPLNAPGIEMKRGGGGDEKREGEGETERKRADGAKNTMGEVSVAPCVPKHAFMILVSFESRWRKCVDTTRFRME